MNNRGFSIVELVVVIGIMGILLSIVTLDFNSMQNKSFIEKQCREFVSDVVSLRMQAMTRKQQHMITINSNNYIFTRYTSPADDGLSATSRILNKNSTYTLTDTSGTAYSGSNIIIDERGFTGSGASFGQTIVVGPAVSKASVNCVVISNARVNAGKMNGANCEFK
jgi:prepilin-type N-terminal cleavage/methylation domain-containing protein